MKFEKNEKRSFRTPKESSKTLSHKVLKDVIVYDEAGNKKIVEKLVDEVGTEKPHSFK